VLKYSQKEELVVPLIISKHRSWVRKYVHLYVKSYSVTIEGFISFENRKADNGVFIDGLKKLFFNRSRFLFNSLNEEPSDNNYIFLNSESSCLRLTKSCFVENSDHVSRSHFDQLVKTDPHQPYISIWYDEASSELSISRHSLGLTPLYYSFIPSSYFAFSTDLNKLLDIIGVLNNLTFDEKWIANYLTGNGNNPYSSDTIYSNVKRLLPGHNLLLTDSLKKLKETPYFTFNPEKWVDLKTMSDYGDIFRELFRNSLRRCVNDNQPIISQLSGGLDSSTISCMLRDIYPSSKIHTLFLEIPLIPKSEKHLALEVATKINSEHHIISPSNEDLDALILHTSLYAYPEQMISGSSITQTLLSKAQSIGAKTMFNGHDGDGIVGIGIEYPEMLYDQFRWNELKDILNIAATVYPYYEIDESWDSFSTKKRQRLYIDNFLYRQLIRKMRELSTRELFSHIDKVRDFFGILSMSSIVMKTLNTIINKIKIGNISPNSIVSTDFLRNIPINSYQSHLPDIMSSGLKNIDIVSFQDIYGGESLSATEHLFALRAQYGIVEKFPFLDNSLFELTMSIPLSIKYDQGRRRGYLREGMKGILPENIRKRGDKGKFSLYGRDAAIRLHHQAADYLTPDCEIWDYVDIKKFKKVIWILKNDKKPGWVTSPVFRVIFLAVWLDWIKKRK
jgi:asparagine synthase (glutamine-hydrolysing)